MKKQRTATDKVREHLKFARQRSMKSRIEKISNDEKRHAAAAYMATLDVKEMALDAIAFKLNEAGHRTPRGSFFNGNAVRMLIAWQLRYFKQTAEPRTKPLN
jgi:hypothetical protein